MYQVDMLMKVYQLRFMSEHQWKGKQNRLECSDNR